MAELTALHFTDMHEDPFLIEAAIAIAQSEKVDVAWCTGDFIGKRHNGVGGEGETLDDRIAKNMQQISQNSPNLQIVQEIIQRNGITQLESIDDIPDEMDKQAFAQAYQAHTQEMQQAVIGAAVQSYKNLRPALERLAKTTKIVGVLGNHDLNIGYKLLSDIIDFAETKPEVKLRGKTGKEFVVKGTINSWELPAIYADPAIQQILAPAFIDYLSGHSSKDVPQAKQAHERELKRLEQTGKADIFLLHKAPGSEMGDGGDHVTKYAQNAGSMYGGHGHTAEIYVKDGKPVFRPGTNHIFVYDYGADKRVEKVRIYRVRK